MEKNDNQFNFIPLNDAFYRINLFKVLQEQVGSRSEELSYKLEKAIVLLDKLEYLIENEIEFKSTLQQNKEKLFTDDSFVGELEKTLISKLDALLEKEKSGKSILNDLFTYIDEYLLVKQYTELFTEVEKISSAANIVFLSYAYVDKSYTIGLFYFFLTNGVYLYVDWMHNKKISSGEILKNKLSQALKNANQFLFLDTANSQLAMQGSYIIRQWCAWEVGNYYKFNINQDLQRKFYLTIYYEDQLIKRKRQNLLLADFKPFVGINKGIIY